jgi:hypothetical protein
MTQIVAIGVPELMVPDDLEHLFESCIAAPGPGVVAGC